MRYEQAQKEIIKLMKSMAGKYRLHNIFSDFCTLAACTISNSVDMQQWQSREDMYMKTIKKYEKNEANNFAKILALVVDGLSGSRMGDFLGELYMKLEISNKDSGQFFTPYDVSKMMAQMLDYETHQGTIELNEPAVGSGGMVVAYAESMRSKGINYQEKLRIVCNDIDYQVVKMCYIQLSLLGVDAIVMQGDTMTQKFNEVWYTPMHLINKVREQKKEKLTEALEGMRKIINDTSEVEEQLSLF